MTALGDIARILGLIDQLPVLLGRITQLEAQMATQAEVNTRLNNVTNNMANDISNLRSMFDELRAAQASGNQAAIEAALDGLSPAIDQLETMETNLRTIGARPADPVPASLPGASGDAGSVPGGDTSAAAGTAT